MNINMNLHELDNFQLLEIYVEEIKFIEYLEKTSKQIKDSIEDENHE